MNIPLVSINGELTGIKVPDSISEDFKAHYADLDIYGTVNITNLFLKGFRDKRKPHREDLIKPLPVNLLKKIPVHLSLDTLNLSNTNIEYAELNEKTNQTIKVRVDYSVRERERNNNTFSI